MRTQPKYFLYILFAFSILSCKKMIEVDPPKTQLTPEKAFADDASALAVLSNIYAQFNLAIDNSLTPTIALYVDELVTTSTNQSDLEYFNGFVSTINTKNLNIWKGLYSVIYQCNALLENIDISPSITLAAKRQFIAEARFLRSFSFFYLVNLFGDVPLLLTANVDITSTAHRNSVAEVYTQIISDLTQAQNEMPETYPSADKVRANKWSAMALLARVYLFQKNWSAAEANANEVISTGIYSPLGNVGSVFKKGSKETILQFWTQNGFTAEATLLRPASGSVPTYPITSNFLGSFETGDLRKAEWISSVIVSGQTYHFPFKYKNRSTTSGANAEYLVALRLGELYLIRAEARARQNNIIDAVTDLNTVRSRAGLPGSSASTQAEILSAIEQERKAELFAEWVHRFIDLKRTDRVNQVMSPLKPAWHDGYSLLPIPESERLINPNLSQNSGY